jgi:hypothetical protein
MAAQDFYALWNDQRQELNMLRDLCKYFYECGQKAAEERFTSTNNARDAIALLKELEQLRYDGYMTLWNCNAILDKWIRAKQQTPVA